MYDQVGSHLEREGGPPPTPCVLHLFHGGWGPSSVSATFFLHSSEEAVQLPQAALFSTHGNAPDNQKLSLILVAHLSAGQGEWK